MDSGELLTAIRTTGFLPTADPVFTDARLRIEMTDALHTLVERAVVNARDGYWLKRHTETTTAKTRYRMPYRAVAGVAASVKIGTTAATATKTTKRYRFFGDYLEFETATQAGQALVIEYYLRPSRLVVPQTTGVISAVSPSSSPPYVTIAGLPVRQLGSGAPATIATGERVDIVKPNGWHECCLVNVVCTRNVFNYEFPAGTDLSDVEVGDYVRAADESEWPCLPDDFHRMLANVTASNVLLAKKNFDGAGAIMQATAPVMERFQDLISPRVKDAPKAVFPKYGVIRRGGRRGFNPDMSR